MKVKIISFVLVLITLTILTVVGWQQLVFKSERINYIDHEIESTMSAIWGSDLSVEDLEEVETAQEAIQSILKEERLNQFVIIYSSDGNLLYRSFYAQKIPIKFNPQSKWTDYQERGHQIRTLTLEQPQGGYFIQVGKILDADVLRWRTQNIYFFYFVGALALVALIVTLIIFKMIFSPVDRLAHSIALIGTDAEVDLNRFREPEFKPLVNSLQGLHHRMKQAREQTLRWTGQLAHEYKTPLTLIKNEILSIRGISRQSYERIDHEVEKLNGLTNDFLQFASIAMDVEQQEPLHAVQVSKLIEEIQAQLNPLYSGRIHFEKVANSLTVFCFPRFLNQVLTNIIVNALKYSPQDSGVTIRMTDHSIQVIDQGKGFDPLVLQRLGQPLNKSNFSTGHGLGLAWVLAICQRYGWRLEIERKNEQTYVELSF